MKRVGEMNMSLWMLNGNIGTQVWITVISFSAIFLGISIWASFKIWELITNGNL